MNRADERSNKIHEWRAAAILKEPYAQEDRRADTPSSLVTSSNNNNKVHSFLYRHKVVTSEAVV